jgi:hypothetical protein
MLNHIDATALAADARYTVSPQRYQIMFADGSAIGLHQVFQNGAPVLMLRAVRFGGLFIVFDLHHMHRELANELPGTPNRDVPGLVYYSLRARYKSADHFNARAIAHVRATLTPSAQAANSMPAPTRAAA